MERCEHYDRPLGAAHGGESEDCAHRPVRCDGCGETWERTELFWCDGLLIGDCCERGREAV